MQPDNKQKELIDLNFCPSGGGDTVTIQSNLNAPLATWARQALQQLGRAKDLSQYYLVKKGTTLHLAPEKTLEELGLLDGDFILLSQKTANGG